MIFAPTKGRIEILERYGIYRWKSSEEFNRRKETIKLYLYEKQNGVCAITMQRYDIEEMDIDHIVPQKLLRMMGFDAKERWTADNLALTLKEANARKGHKIYNEKRFMELFTRSCDCSIKLDNHETHSLAYRRRNPHKYSLAPGYY